ncbi:MAG: hypothetical protein EKK55_20535 [Rhodocyclaceae bacterium]|nr:MAG: hypothetical protein EKK55_20535 [Rhodocyclaceae bacterium]
MFFSNAHFRRCHFIGLTYRHHRVSLSRSRSGCASARTPRAHPACAAPVPPLGRAVAYALSNWTALTESAGSGLLGPDNKTAQRAMRPMPISRSD